MARQCYAIGGRINFNYDTVSLCHGIDIGDRVIWRYGCDGEFTPEYYKASIKEITEKNLTDAPLCSGCSNLIQGAKNPEKIEIITINPMYYCQNRCIYCGNFRGERKSLYDPLPMIRAFIDEGMIAGNCLFDWGGGEPTASDDFERIFLFLLQKGFMQRVNTNAVIISDVLKNHLDNDLVSLRISLDAGNRRAFLATKGRDKFRQVVDNIKIYREKTENLLLKYVVTNSNSDEQSIRDFISLAAKLDIKAVCIDTDMLSYGWEDYPDLLRFTERELKAACLLRDLAHENKINVQIGYVWTARDPGTPSRDFNNIYKISELIDRNENYALPEDLSAFHRKRNAEFRIMPTVLASFETLYGLLRDKKIVLYGAGNNGKKLLKALRKFRIPVACFCDKAKAGRTIDGVEVKSMETVLKKLDDDTAVIITPYKVRDILREFQEKNYIDLTGHLYYIDEFRYGDRVLEEME
ncbi:MAG TPA: hypothetical protein DF613_01560 [Lachnospiraceae bacterium]|nr:hypothetical protein [Lachnospiraceae bacterium]